jgi:hypothetical protein
MNDSLQPKLSSVQLAKAHALFDTLWMTVNDTTLWNNGLPVGMTAESLDVLISQTKDTLNELLLLKTEVHTNQ